MSQHPNQMGSMFITGVSSGIGMATAKHFASKGWVVFGTVINMEELQEARSSLPSIIPFVMDVRNEAAIRDTARQVEEALEGTRLDVLINCAGVASCGPLELTTTDEFQSVFSVNVFGTAAVTRHFLPLLRDKDLASERASPSSEGASIPLQGTQQCQASLGAKGYRKQPRRSGFGRLHAPRIINMSSLVGCIAIPWASVYSASKHAVEALSDVLRLELRHQGIKVVAIEPGFVKTGLPGSMWSAAQRTLEGSQPGPRQVYERQFLKGVEVMQGMAEHLDVPVSSVVSMIERAVLAASPRARYSLDTNTSLFILLRTRILTDWIWDAIYPWAERLQVWMIHRAAAAKGKKFPPS